MSEVESWRAVGKRIRYLRKANELTLKQLSAGCGMSVNTLSLVERGEVAPMVTTLCRIANALGVPVGHFFQEVCPTEVVINRAGELEAQEITRQAMTALAGEYPVQSGMLPDESCYPAGFASLTVLCVSGCIEYQVQDRLYRLQPGDSLTFNGRAPHTWINPHKETGVAIMILPPNPEFT